MKGRLEKIFDLEKQLHDFEQKHADLEEKLPLTKKRQSHIKKHFPARPLP